MPDLKTSAAQRANASYVLTGDTADIRRTSARILIQVAKIKGEEPDQWVVDVAEGRLPA